MFSPKFSLLTSFLLGLAIPPRCACHPIASLSVTKPDIRTALQEKAAGIPFSIIAPPEGIKINNYHGQRSGANQFLEGDLQEQCDAAGEAFFLANPSLEESYLDFFDVYLNEIVSCTDVSNCGADFSDNSVAQGVLNTCTASGGQAALYSFAIKCSASDEQQMLNIGLDIKAFPLCIPPGCDVNAIIASAAGSADETVDSVEQSVDADTGVDVQCSDLSFSFEDANGNSRFQATGDGSKTFAELVASEQSDGKSAASQGKFAFLVLVVGFAVSFAAVV